MSFKIILIFNYLSFIILNIKNLLLKKNFDIKIWFRLMKNLSSFFATKLHHFMINAIYLQKLQNIASLQGKNVKAAF